MPIVFQPQTNFNTLITKISGKLLTLTETTCTLLNEPFEYEIFVTDFTRRALQLKLDEVVSLHTIHYIDGNPQKGGRMTPRLVGFDTAIEQQDFKALTTMPGVGAAMAEKIVAQLRRKMAKFALLVQQDPASQGTTSAEHSIADETFQILVSLGHPEVEARRLLEQPLASKKKFKSVEDLLQAVYETNQ